ncbi:lysM and putative peptidoglycan-binding domain-containing protein 3-like protein [Leptotrombidium deliense]|uniref:LysM and putative peptidoglycan-binding domain-containing protein 3-like protein n=1 Tax=Leptotrombidium deliense TaxID=299467 RepID=A0A443SG33_9ACAR|nr:lysM and putative peptidoglycan-binding domain-containing protein 3-like protein [Leptotrombidium deliense]
MPVDSKCASRSGCESVYERLGDIERQSEQRYKKPNKPNVFTRLANRGYKQATCRRVNNGDDTTYVFDSSEDDNECNFESNIDNFELKQRSQTREPERQKKQLREHLHYEIQPNDTLQNLSLRCGCSVSELKASNNLINDQDFYGLRFLKIPVKKYGILSEVLTHQINTSHCSETIDNTNDDQRRSPPLIVNLGLKQTFASDDVSDMNKFLTHLDRDLENIRKSTLNFSSEFQPTIDNSTEVPKKNVNVYYCDEENCGLTWTNVVILALFVCVLIPVIYLLIFKEHAYELDMHLKESNH